METITKSPRETFELGQKIGSDLKGGEVLALVGDLGSGKTTFIQGLAKSLSITEPVISPTFILMRSYPIVSHRPPITSLYHLDLYRLEGDIKPELENLGVFDLWGKENNIVVIEWAQKAKIKYPDKTVWINFFYIDDSKRKIIIKK